MSFINRETGLACITTSCFQPSQIPHHRHISLMLFHIIVHFNITNVFKFFVFCFRRMLGLFFENYFEENDFYNQITLDQMVTFFINKIRKTRFWMA